MAEKIHTDKAPAAIGPYSQAAKVGNDISVQTNRVCRNLKAVLEAAGSSLEHVIKTTCFLADMNDFAKFNDVYSEYFKGKPARSCVAVKTLPKGALVEIEVIAEAE